jgi:hypothetical protein
MTLEFSQQFYFTNVYNICKIKLSDEIRIQEGVNFFVSYRNILNGLTTTILLANDLVVCNFMNIQYIRAYV